MRKIFRQGLVLVLVLLFAVSCRKSEVPGCARLVSYDYYDGIADVHSIDYFSYKNGLIDEVLAFGLRFNTEYNAQKKLIGSKVYDGETLLYIIRFVYKNNKVVEEIWRDATTQEIYDNVFLTYDQDGNIIRSESFILEYYCINTYNANRSLKSWQIVDHGLNFAKAEYTYNDNYKNPFTTLKGVDYLFWSTNSAFGIKAGERWYSSEKVTIYNESGEPSIYYDQDPAKTVWHVGQQPCPLQADYVDKITSAEFINTFEYENCNSEISSQNARINQNRASKNTELVKRMKPYLRFPQKEAIKNLRR